MRDSTWESSVSIYPLYIYKKPRGTKMLTRSLLLPRWRCDKWWRCGNPDHNPKYAL